MAEIFKTTYNSPIGEITIVIENNRVSRLNFTDSIKEDLSKIENSETKFSKTVKNTLDQYFRGESVDLTSIPIKIQSCDFDIKIYQILINTPYGDLTTYGELAKLYNKQYNSKITGQAVGSAMARNKILLIIPCHRVIRKDGSLGGFSSGNSRKKKLIEIERNGNKETEKANTKAEKSH